MGEANPSASGVRQVATLGGGCFWCTEAVGGTQANPSYEEVCSGRTGHAEVVRIVYDPSRITFEEILQVFFVIHDPTTRDRQGNDVGPQYRSVIFYHTPEQKTTAERVIARLEAEKVWRDPIVTEIVPESTFYRAEAYHQEYYARNPYQPYCQFVVAPKVAKFRKHFLDKLKKPQ